MKVVDEFSDEFEIVERSGYNPGFYTSIAKDIYNEDDADLIASAPELKESNADLLEALQELESDVRNGNDCCGSINKAHAAISKALGTSEANTK